MVRIINVYMYMHIYSAFYIHLCVSMRLKREARQVNQKGEYRDHQYA